MPSIIRGTLAVAAIAVVFAGPLAPARAQLGIADLRPSACIATAANPLPAARQRLLEGDRRPLVLANLVEASGRAEEGGRSWFHGIDMAVNQINATGGLIGRQIKVVHFDTTSDPEMARVVAGAAVALSPYAVLGPTLSSSTRVAMPIIRDADLPHLSPAEAPDLTLRGYSNLFRVSVSTGDGMRKLVSYLRDDLQAKQVAVVWTNDDFGRSLRMNWLTWLNLRRVQVTADIEVDVGRGNFDFAARRVREAHPDALIVLASPADTAKLLVDLRGRGLDRPVIVDPSTMAPRLIDLAGQAANGVRSHVDLTPESPAPALRRMLGDFEQLYKYRPNANAARGYMAIYMIKAVTERNCSFDSRELVNGLRNLTVFAREEPGVLMDLRFDGAGNVDRESYLLEIRSLRETVTRALPAFVATR